MSLVNTNIRGSMDLKEKKGSDSSNTDSNSKSEKGPASQASSGKKAVIILVVAVLVVAAVVGAWYYKTNVLDKSNNANTSQKADDSKKEKTEADQAEEALADTAKDIEARIKKEQQSKSELEIINQMADATKQVSTAPDKALEKLHEECVKVGDCKDEE